MSTFDILLWIDGHQVFSVSALVVSWHGCAEVVDIIGFRLTTLLHGHVGSVDDDQDFGP